ncbi:SGNH/GDSL hydrolase family protein [Nocardia stercoris]|uniref:SGNH/GDSL hydrolase family protein n=1 Tax=Nocardia stercoris TaxID=2483361 RepID=A0A3M2L0X6_9NOCA|nr:SGNH/GDSL hydrolase family protein [Nocardia stercoris]RMI31352.1 SGNH/GDSL hydrolase family protein [Nocardia stercoris]
MSTYGRWLLAAAVAAVVPAGSQVVAQAAPAADSSTGADVVVFGDSFASDEPLVSHEAVDDCVRSATSWPNQLKALTGLTGTGKFVDESCSGGSIDTGTGYTLTVQARLAAQAGAFGPDTKLVAVQLGMKDSWRNGTVDGPYSKMTACDGFDLSCLDTDQTWVTDDHGITGTAFADRMRKVVDYIRYYAPNARIVLVGYPEEQAPGTTTLCQKVGPVSIPVPYAPMTGYLDWLDKAQREAAGLLGAEFLDVRALTAGHGLCAPEPWVADVNPPDIGQPITLHPLPAGNTAVAEALASRVTG